MTLQHRVLPEVRRRRLYDLLHAGRGVRIIEAHSGLSALVGSRAVFDAPGGEHLEFDGLWVSSLTNSAIKGLPDVELYTLERRVETIEEIAGVTNKPIIVDADTGGIDPNFDYLCSRLEALGVSAVVVEDKRYPKKNSLLAVADHELEDPDVFCRKLSHARGVCLSEQFMIIARLESLIARNDLADALRRARAYLLAGVDAILIHSKSRTPDEIHAFAEGYERLSAELGFRKPLCCIPTTYNRVTDRELFARGFNVVIHANHLLRTAHHAMEAACEQILAHDRTYEVEDMCTPVAKLFDLVGS